MTGTPSSPKPGATEAAVTASEPTNTQGDTAQAQNPTSAPTAPIKTDSLVTTTLVAIVANLATVLIIGLSIIVLHEYEKLGRYPMTVPELAYFIGVIVVLLIVKWVGKLLQKRQKRLAAEKKKEVPPLNWECIVTVVNLLFIFFGLLVCIFIVIFTFAAIGYADGIKLADEKVHFFSRADGQKKRLRTRPSRRRERGRHLGR